MISGIKPHQSEQRSEKIGVPPGEGALGIADFLRIRQRSAALCAPLEIEDAECVAKSYPEFFDDLETLGAEVQLHR